MGWNWAWGQGNGEDGYLETFSKSRYIRLWNNLPWEMAEPYWLSLSETTYTRNAKRELLHGQLLHLPRPEKMDFSKPLPPLISTAPCFAEISTDGNEFSLALCGKRRGSTRTPWDRKRNNPAAWKTCTSLSGCPGRGTDHKAADAFHWATTPWLFPQNKDWDRIQRIIWKNKVF